jgi:ATP-dependent exoDNAse (exonuclease V) alpha subunit
MIPRIKLNPDDGSLPFPMQRLQFPVKLAYCITINKAQGQSLNRVGIHLAESVFGHGQLYVAIREGKYLMKEKGDN